MDHSCGSLLAILMIRRTIVVMSTDGLDSMQVENRKRPNRVRVRNGKKETRSTEVRPGFNPPGISSAADCIALASYSKVYRPAIPCFFGKKEQV